MTIQEIINGIDFSFLKSNRFWALVIGAITIYLQSKNLIGQVEATLIETIVFGFTGIRTIDRFSEKLAK
jgi:hypothetical protein